MLLPFRPHVLTISLPLAASLAMALASAPIAAGAPLPLEEAVQRALAKNYTLRVEALTPQIAQAEVTAALGIFDPAFQASYEYSEDASAVTVDPTNPARPSSSLAVQDHYDVGIGGLLPLGTTYRLGATAFNARGTYNEFNDRYFTFTGLRLEQPLLRGFGPGANLARIRIARTERSRSEWHYRQAVIDTITQVIFVYQNVHFATQNLRVAQRSRELAQGLVAENERRFRVGSMSEYDVVAARAEVAKRDESVLLAERFLLDQQNFLFQLISDDRLMAAMDQSLEITTPPTIGRSAADPIADFRQALESRPDYQQARLWVQRGRYNRKLQANQLLPEINLVGSYGYHGYSENDWSDSRSQLQDRDRRSYTAGAVVRIPLTFTEGRGRYRAAKLELKQAEMTLERLEQSIMVSVANAAGQIETAAQRVSATRSARELAQQSLDAEIKRLRAGTSSTFVVLRYQEQLAMAEIREFQARTDEQKAIAEYDRQIGTTLQTWNVALEPPPTK